MGESMYALYTSKEQEVKRLEQATDNHGFMKEPSIFGLADNVCYPFNKIPPVYPAPFSPRRMNPADSPSTVIKERISSLVSAADYQILVRTTYTSPKEQINRYIEILMNLMKSGVFNIDEKEDEKPNIPITDPQNSVVSNLGTIVRPADDGIVLSNIDNNICDCTIENNNKCCATELLDRRTKEYKAVVEAMNKLKEACSAAGISMITAVQAADKKDQSK